MNKEIKEKQMNKENKPATKQQVGGNHYKDFKIQPIEIIHANKLDYFQGNIIKYTMRYKLKNGEQDLDKAIHYLNLLKELEYPKGDK